jgi:hypothetical protein
MVGLYGGFPRGRGEATTAFQVAASLLQPPPHEGRGAQLYADAKPRPFLFLPV